MLVWKTQTLNVNMASLRYRCLLPLRYLDKLGISSTIYSGADPIKITADTQAVIFVKSFREEDVEACEQAYQLGVPIILDICDNIFIEEYSLGNDYVPAHNFQLMARMATAIVTTGSAMKAAVEKALADFDGGNGGAIASLPMVVAIPDGSESLSDIQYAFHKTQWRRLLNKAMRPVKALKKRMRPLKKLRQIYGWTKRLIKWVVYGIKGHISQLLRRYGLRAPLVSVPLVERSALTEQSTVAEQSVSSERLLSQPTAKPKRASTEPTPLLPKPWPTAVGVKTILWFGNYGAKYGNFGMLNILEAADAITSLSQVCSLRLMVVSNSYETYQKHIAPLPFDTDYLPWHPRKIYEYIRASDVVIIPNSQSVYSICKSANRAVLSLAQGTPVVASRTPALEMFADCVQLDNWEAGLQAYLLHPDFACVHVAQAQQVIATHLRGDVIARQWLSLLEQIAPLAVEKEAA